jgi:hypothetical protein
MDIKQTIRSAIILGAALQSPGKWVDRLKQLDVDLEPWDFRRLIQLVTQVLPKTDQNMRLASSHIGVRDWTADTVVLDEVWKMVFGRNRTERLHILEKEMERATVNGDEAELGRLSAEYERILGTPIRTFATAIGRRFDGTERGSGEDQKGS